MHHFSALLCLIILGSLGRLKAQQRKVESPAILVGALQDSNQTGIGDATIKLMKASDTAQAKYQLSDSLGRFLFARLSAGTYIIDIQRQNYARFQKYISIDPTEDTLDLGKVLLTRSSNEMEAVTVTGVRPVTMNGDTTEFNADAFSLKPDASAGDLLNKMAGIEVDKDGNVQSDGEAVPKVYVNGKPFFGDNPTMAIKNLPADAIKKIQVYDAQTDQSKFTGFDDGERIRTINIVTRRKFKGLFGKPSIAGGSRGLDLHKPLYRLDGKAFLYGPEKQLSFIAKANNLSGAQVGKNHHTKLGANYRNMIGQKTKVSGSYSMDKGNSHQASETWRQDLYSNDTVFNKNTKRTSWSSDIKHNFSLDWETKFDSTNELYVRPRYSFGHSESSNSSNTLIDSAYLDNVVHKNKTDNNGNARSDQENFSLSTTYNHRFKKRGRSISLDINLKQSNNERTRQSNTSLFDYIADSLDLTRRQFLNSSNNKSYRANLDYTEPFGLHHMVQLELNAAYSSSESDQRTFNYDEATEDYTNIDTTLTNLYGNTYQSTRSTLSYRYHTDYIRLSFGSGVQWGKVNSKNLSKQTNIHQQYVNLYPTATLRYKFSKWREIKFRYHGRTSQPDVNQMQPIEDNSNPLYIRAGNPDLKQRFNHNASIEYRNRDSLTNKSLYAKVNMEVATNSVVNSIKRLDNGGQYSQPVNINGNYHLSAYLGFGIPIAFIPSNLDLQTRINHQHQVSLIDQVKNYTTKLQLSETFRWRTNLEKLFDINFTTRPTYHIINYSVSRRTNGNYFDQMFSFDGTWYTESGWESSAEFNYTLYSGLPKEQRNNSTILNLTVARSFCNRAAKLTLSVTDLLNQSKGISFTRSDNYIQQSHSDVFKRYFLLTFSYNLRNLNFNGKRDEQQSDSYPMRNRRNRHGS